MIQCSCRRNGRPGAVCPSSKTTMSGNVRRLYPFVERLVIFGHLPIAEPASPTSRMKAVASAISWASCADQEPPARRCVGAKNTRERENPCARSRP